jgi:hypothetical protein
MNRSEESLFDPRIADWLEDDPHAAPEQALEVVLAAFPSIKQRRAWRSPWRFTMPTVTKALALGATALIIVIGGAWLLGPRPPSVGTPSPSPSANPSPSTEARATQTSAPETTQPATTTSFTSPVYGYTVEHPVPYVPTPATEPWVDGFVGNAEPWVDRFFSLASFVGIASQPLDDTETAAAWMDAYAASAAGREPCDVPVDSWTDTPVSGGEGRRADFNCQGSAGLEIVWVADRQGWVISGERAVVEQMMNTFTTD